MRVYACSGIFIAHLNGSEKHSALCTELLEAAEAGKVELHSSYLTVTEVVASQRRVVNRSSEDEKIVRDLMDSSFVKYSAVDFVVADLARIVNWDFRIRAADSVHVATAILRRCDVFYTLDGPLAAKSSWLSSRVQLLPIRFPEALAAEQQLPFES